MQEDRKHYEKLHRSLRAAGGQGGPKQVEKALHDLFDANDGISPNILKSVGRLARQYNLKEEGAQPEDLHVFFRQYGQHHPRKAIEMLEGAFGKQVTGKREPNQRGPTRPRPRQQEVAWLTEAPTDIVAPLFGAADLCETAGAGIRYKLTRLWPEVLKDPEVQSEWLWACPPDWEVDFLFTQLSTQEACKLLQWWARSDPEPCIDWLERLKKLAERSKEFQTIWQSLNKEHLRPLLGASGDYPRKTALRLLGHLNPSTADPTQDPSIGTQESKPSGRARP